MGQLSRFDLGRIIKEYNTLYLFETGTLWGDAILYALDHPFDKIISVEIVPEIAARAKDLFLSEKKVKIIETDSISALNEQLPYLKENIIFWLDAHFPGADAGYKNYNSKQGEQFRLPLQAELETIARLRRSFNDVLILDDLRIYEDGPYENGKVPPEALPKGIRNLDFVIEHFSGTHVILKCYRDEGYILLFPKTKYEKLHSKPQHADNKNVVYSEDHYLS